MLKSIITGTGSYIPTVIKTNQDFSSNTFYTENQLLIDKPSSEISEKFKQITGIAERRYVSEDFSTSTIGTEAAKLAISDANIDPETLDQIIVAHNFGDVKKGNIQSDLLPAIASRIKHALGIKNPKCVVYDIYLAVQVGYKD